MGKQDDIPPLRARLVGQLCSYCDVVLVAGHGPASVSLDHALPKSLGGTFEDPRHRITACKKCNGDRGNRLLRVWLDVLLRAADDRCEAVTSVIAEFYEALPAHEADAIVGMPTPPSPKPKKYVAPLDALPPTGRRCLFPACACSQTCERYGRPTAKDAPA